MTKPERVLHLQPIDPTRVWENVFAVAWVATAEMNMIGVRRFAVCQEHADGAVLALQGVQEREDGEAETLDEPAPAFGPCCEPHPIHDGSCSLRTGHPGKHDYRGITW